MPAEDIIIIDMNVLLETLTRIVRSSAKLMT